MAATIMETRELARLTNEELVDTHYRERDLATRDELVDRFMPLARKLAVRYVHTREPRDDLVQVASIGLLNAIDRFDPERGKKFTTFAVPTILGELKRYFRDKGWTVHVPRDLKERALALSRHTERLSTELHRSPTVLELADALGCTVEQTVEAIDAGENYHLTSLDAPIAQDDQDHCALADTLGSEDDGFELAEDRHALASKLGRARRAGTTSTRPAPPARAHPARDQPADRILPDARLPSTAQIDAVTQRRRGTGGVCMKPL